MKIMPMFCHNRHDFHIEVTCKAHLLLSRLRDRHLVISKSLLRSAIRQQAFHNICQAIHFRVASTFRRALLLKGSFRVLSLTILTVISSFPLVILQSAFYFSFISVSFASFLLVFLMLYRSAP